MARSPTNSHRRVGFAYTAAGDEPARRLRDEPWYEHAEEDRQSADIEHCLPAEMWHQEEAQQARADEPNHEHHLEKDVYPLMEECYGASRYR